MLKPLQTSQVDSISKGRDLKLFWNERFWEIASTFMLPIKTDCAVSDSISLNGLSSGLPEKSWFSTRLFCHQMPNLHETCFTSCMSFPVECTDFETIVSSLITLSATVDQKKIFKKWTDVSRWVFNCTIDFVRSCIGFAPHWMEIKKDAIILKSNGIYPKVSGEGLKFHESLPEFPMDSRLYRLLLHLDQLYSKRAKANTRNKKSLTKAIRRLSAKIKNLIDELHWKTARFLCENFSVILMPTYEIKQMVEENNRKIRTKTVRSMLGFSNFKFKQRLKWIAKKLGKTVLDVCEAYTSKTHPQTGQVKNIGSAKWIKLENRSMLTEIW